MYIIHLIHDLYSVYYYIRFGFVVVYMSVKQQRAHAKYAEIKIHIPKVSKQLYNIHPCL